MENTILPLQSNQRRFLRGLGHHLKPVVMVGQHGISETVIDSLLDALAAHELVKVKLGQNCPLPKKEAAEQLAEKSYSSLVQLIGKTVLLYSANPELPPDKQIHLPK